MIGSITNAATQLVLYETLRLGAIPGLKNLGDSGNLIPKALLEQEQYVVPIDFLDSMDFLVSLFPNPTPEVEALSGS